MKHPTPTKGMQIAAWAEKEGLEKTANAIDQAIRQAREQALREAAEIARATSEDNKYLKLYDKADTASFIEKEILSLIGEGK